MERNGILESYLLDKGAATTERDLLEILKELLRNENHGIRSARVERCTHISVEELPLSKILLGNDGHYDRVEPREPKSPSGGLLITGVVVREDSADRIADGYHRLKHSLNSGLTHGTFIVISPFEI